MKSSILKKLFYPPHYLTMTVAGVDIRNTGIKYIEFIDRKGLIYIKNSGEIPLAPGIFKDGDILNKAALVKALAGLKNKISADFVKVSIPEEKTYLFDTQIPFVPQANVRESLEFKLEENVPLKADEIVFEYDLVSSEPDANKMLVVNVSAIPKKVIASFTEAFEEAGLMPLSYEMESKMIGRAVMPRKDHEPTIIIHIKDESTMLALVIDRMVRFTSTVAIGDLAMKQSLKKIDPSFAGNFDTLSNTLSVPGHAASTDLFYSMFNVFSVLKDEIEKFNSYLVSHAKNKHNLLPEKISRIVIAGKSALLPGFCEHLSQNFNADVALADVWTNTFDLNDYLPAISFGDSLNLATAIGLAIPYYRT